MSSDSTAARRWLGPVALAVLYVAFWTSISGSILERGARCTERCCATHPVLRRLWRSAALVALVLWVAAGGALIGALAVAFDARLGLGLAVHVCATLWCWAVCTPPSPRATTVLPV
jgi:hypothetical protein